MGTNYYRQNLVGRCSECGRPHETEYVQRLHIGKSSFGWCFSLHVYPERGILSPEDWKREWSHEGFEIRDEYDRLVTQQTMWETITNRQHSGSHKSIDGKGNEYSLLGQYELGPNNLLRNPAKEGECWPGEGTWDCCAYEFF
jgi:hypothetical protein